MDADDARLLSQAASTHSELLLSRGGTLETEHSIADSDLGFRRATRFMYASHALRCVEREGEAPQAGRLDWTFLCRQ
jgi:hypothetical protein